jgi:hypothetical protein
LAFWVVSAVFDADDVAVLLLFCEAELEPPTDTPLPLTVTGTLALTAFCVAFADESALCTVSEDCESSWDWPEPPQPAVQPLLLDCVWPAPCVVALPLEAPEPPLLQAV